MIAAVARERAAGGASWTTIGAAQDPPVSRQAAQQRYQRLLRRANLTNDGDTVLEPPPEPARHEQTSPPTVNDGVDGPSRRSPQRREPPHTAISAGGMGAAEDRRDLIRASDYPTSGAWLVTVEGMTVGSVQPTYSSTRAKRWTALINGVSVLGGRAFPSRDKAAIQVLLEHEHHQHRTPPTPDGTRRSPTGFPVVQSGTQRGCDMRSQPLIFAVPHPNRSAQRL